MTDAPPAPPTDDKDWTWVLGEPCAECGFDAATVDPAEIAARTRSTMAAITETLHRPDATQRPSPDIWSALEYGCHVRDVCRIFDMRVGRMLDEDNPVFANWDQDQTALDDRYWEQDPGEVHDQCLAAAEVIATRFDGVTGDQWDRPGKRSNGALFTVDSIGRYFLHDLTHHLHDIQTASS